MDTETLIARLAHDLAATPRYGLVKRLVAALVIGGAAALAALLATVGLRPDLVEASRTAPFWLKAGFTLSMLGVSLILVRRLARPAVPSGWAWWGYAFPIAVVAGLSIGELLTTASGSRAGLIIGHTSLRCVTAIPLLAIPVFVALLWAFRQFAPTQLRSTGAAAGLLAGSAAAAVYTLACAEYSGSFLLTWYTLSITSTGAVGGIVGPRILRW